MKQYDRQLQVLTRIDERLQEQTTEISQLRRAIQSGIRVSTTQSSGGLASSDNEFFKHVRAAQQKPDYAMGDWYVDAFPVKVPIITPFIVQDLYGMWVNGRICEWLLTYEPYTLE